MLLRQGPGLPRPRAHHRGRVNNPLGSPRAFIKLLLFDLAVLIGVWIVHQTEYLIEYGNRFNAVMADTPHRLYMEPSALVFALAAASAIGICAIRCLGHARLTRESAGRLTPRIRRRLHALASPVPVTRVGWAAAALFVAQAAVYTVQENLESWQSTGTLPGTAVLVGSSHLTVLPLHALVASVLAIILTTATTRVRQVEHTSRVARVLAALFEARTTDGPRPASVYVHLPNLRPAAGCQSLRSPPLSS